MRSRDFKVAQKIQKFIAISNASRKYRLRPEGVKSSIFATSKMNFVLVAPRISGDKHWKPVGDELAG
ncbi:MAG: hypothetical protein A3G20_09435 [Acidobacteria bacterium RIFCSPLOWO2_12_FULL_59_11]|nr:MAG: hypothetical protein A3G20_09435 [Acidobacteria bacterium RIFCSPLOWO2_12_FULL_59_11]